MNKRSGFTLIELIVSVTLLAIIMLSIFMIYSNILGTDKKLELNRVLQENTRNMVEGIASEIRNKGIDYSFYKASTQNLDYSGSGNTLLAIKTQSAGISSVFCMQKQRSSCDQSCYDNPRGCFFGKLDSDIRLSDDRVMVKNLRFYISGMPSESITSEDKEGKVTVVFDLSIAPGKGISPAVAKENELHIQTTLSEKIYKNMY